MAPGMLTSAHRGGLSFQHGGGRHVGGNYGQRFGAPNPGRAYGPQPSARERFYVDAEGHGVLEAGDRLTVEIDDEGNTVVSLEKPDAPEVGEEAKRRGWPFGRMKMSISQTSDSSVSVEADNGARLVVSGNPADGEVLIVEVPAAAEEGDTSG